MTIGRRVYIPFDSTNYEGSGMYKCEFPAEVPYIFYRLPFGLSLFYFYFTLLRFDLPQNFGGYTREETSIPQTFTRLLNTCLGK